LIGLLHGAFSPCETEWEDNLLSNILRQHVFIAEGITSTAVLMRAELDLVEAEKIQIYSFSRRPGINNELLSQKAFMKQDLK
jgi:hypothetical protein